MPDSLRAYLAGCLPSLARPRGPEGVSDPLQSSPVSLPCACAWQHLLTEPVPTGARGSQLTQAGEGKQGCTGRVSVLQIFWPASREQVEHCQLAGKNVEVSRAGSPRLTAFCGLPWMLNTHISPKGSAGSA